jgi:hypothetical protein
MNSRRYNVARRATATEEASANGAISTLAWGNAPGITDQKEASAESAIQDFSPRLQRWNQ